MALPVTMSRAPQCHLLALLLPSYVGRIEQSPMCHFFASLTIVEEESL